MSQGKTLMQKFADVVILCDSCKSRSYFAFHIESNQFWSSCLTVTIFHSLYFFGIPYKMTTFSHKHTNTCINPIQNDLDRNRWPIKHDTNYEIPINVPPKFTQIRWHVNNPHIGNGSKPIYKIYSKMAKLKYQKPNSNQPQIERVSTRQTIEDYCLLYASPFGNEPFASLSMFHCFGIV